MAARDLARLPTPAPSEGGASSSSPSFSSLPPPSTAFLSPAYALSPLPAVHPLPLPLLHDHVLPKSRSSLSLNFSAWESGGQSRFISALPSPSISNAGSISDFAERDRDRDLDLSTGNKTTSFFSTSFTATPPPSLLPQRSSSVSVRGKHGDGQIYGLAQAGPPPHQHTRSVSAERTPQARSETANAVFFTATQHLPTPTPPPPPPILAVDFNDDDPVPGPSQPRRSFEYLPAEEVTPKAEAPIRRRDALKKPAQAVQLSPAPRRRIVLLDEPGLGLTTSPDSSPINHTHAHAHVHVHSPPEHEGRPRATTVSSPSSERPLPPTPVEPPAQAPAPAAHHHHAHAHAHPPHLHREPPSTVASAVHPVALHAGATISSDDCTLILERPLGQGAFSSVWLASDPQHTLGPCPPHERRKSESYARRRTDRRMAGLVPAPRLPSGGLFGGSGRERERSGERAGSVVLDEEDGDGWSVPAGLTAAAAAAMSPGAGGRSPDGLLSVPGRELDGPGKETVRLVAVKMLDRAMCEANDRTRISFVREVEVLRHISHPSIVSYLHSFTTPTHHCLVLEYLAGGELFSLVDDDEKYGRLTEPLLRRMFGELVRAVGWMHGVALVHRDIKLENILLTCDPFSLPSYPSLADLPTPLLKISDFGLSRFVDTASPLLQTRCGSESYAAPEIVMGQAYDGRQTDAWACGVVLYALATRVLPFDAREDAHAGTGSSVRTEREGRKALLFRIAKGDYSWPRDPRPSIPAPVSSAVPISISTSDDGDAEMSDGRSSSSTASMSPRLGPTIVRPQNLATPGLKKVVARLLVRDPAKRAKVSELWDEEWMCGEGAPSPPHRDQGRGERERLVDVDSIGEVARREVV